MRFGWAKIGIIVGTLAISACGRAEPAVSSADLAANLKAAETFLATNAKADGIVSLPSGVQYKIVKSGPVTGIKPDGNDLVSVNYEGTLTDGTVFDSSFERGVPFATHLDEVVAGWGDALTQMRPGDEWLLYIPPERGYGERDAGEIPPNSVLVFRVQLLDVAPIPGAPRPQRGTVAQG